MSASDRPGGRPVVLLARPGAACERLREAVLAAGGELVLEADPLALEAAALQAAGPAMVLVALEPAVEDALERLAPALEAPQLELMFEEAELAARREGWDAQRWTRHLAAKLQGHDQVLPPGQEEEALPLPEPGMPERPAERHVDAPLQFHVDEAELHVDEVPADRLYAPPVAADRPEVLTFEELMARAPAAPAPVVPAQPALPPELPPALPPSVVRPSAAAPPALPGGFHDWSLVEDDAYGAPSPSAAPLADEAVQEPEGGLLASAALSLVELESEAGAGVQGATLLLAGIGGPDAVRRLLGALPEDYPLPVLVQMRLDGGRYANLVKQMSRVAMLPVALAEAGRALDGGHVYVLQDGVGVASREGGLQFMDGAAPLLEALPVSQGAVVMLSGADPSLVPAVLAFAERGGWIAGQSGEGCYDPEAASQLAVAGHPAGTPEYLAGELAQRSAG